MDLFFVLVLLAVGVGEFFAPKRPVHLLLTLVACGIVGSLLSWWGALFFFFSSSLFLIPQLEGEVWETSCGRVIRDLGLVCFLREGERVVGRFPTGPQFFQVRLKLDDGKEAVIRCWVYFNWKRIPPNNDLALIRWDVRSTLRDHVLIYMRAQGEKLLVPGVLHRIPDKCFSGISGEPWFKGFLEKDPEGVGVLL